MFMSSKVFVWHLAKRIVRQKSSKTWIFLLRQFSSSVPPANFFRLNNVVFCCKPSSATLRMIYPHKKTQFTDVRSFLAPGKNVEIFFFNNFGFTFGKQTFLSIKTYKCKIPVHPQYISDDRRTDEFLPCWCTEHSQHMDSHRCHIRPRLWD